MTALRVLGLCPQLHVSRSWETVPRLRTRLHFPGNPSAQIVLLALGLRAQLHISPPREMEGPTPRPLAAPPRAAGMQPLQA